MIYGFDDNKNRVEVPDASFKVVDYEYNVFDNSLDNPLLINVGEAVFTIDIIMDNDKPFRIAYVKEEPGVIERYLIMKIIPIFDGDTEITSTTYLGDGAINGLVSNVYIDSTNSVANYIELYRYGLDYNIETKTVTSFTTIRWFILRIS